MTTPLLVVLSGGMDSTTLAYSLAKTGPIRAVSFDYGQRHRKELDYARLTTQRLGVEHTIVPMSWLAELIAGRSSLVNRDEVVPDGHYAEATMRATVVPNRNSIMANIAAGIAIANGDRGIALGVHAGDHFIYPDCRPAWANALHVLLLTANEGFLPDDWVGVQTPFIHATKADIAAVGTELGVPWSDTWSCYKGGTIHCGSCGTCFERREAFTLAGIDDPTEYEATPQYEAPVA